MPRTTRDEIIDLINKKPWLFGALVGGGVGLPIGAFRSDPGEELGGAAAGMLAGAGLGAGAGAGTDALKRLLGLPGTHATVGSIAGIAGGLLGAQKMAPWVKKRLMRDPESDVGGAEDVDTGIPKGAAESCGKGGHDNPKEHWVHKPDAEEKPKTVKANKPVASSIEVEKENPANIKKSMLFPALTGGMLGRMTASDKDEKNKAMLGGVAGGVGGSLLGQLLETGIADRLGRKSALREVLRSSVVSDTGTVLGGLAGGYLSQKREDKQRNPKITKQSMLGLVMPAAIGGGLGYVTADEENKNKGMWMGAAGGIGGNVLGSLLALGLTGLPKRKQDLARVLRYATIGAVGGNVLGGIGGGLLARRSGKVPTDTDEVKQGEEKAMENEVEKTAEEIKAANDRVNAFDFGIDLFCHEHGLNKQALAEACGVEGAEKLAEEILKCHAEASQEQASEDPASEE